MDYSQLLFLYFCLFNTQLTVYKCSLLNFFADDWIWTADLWYWKLPLYQLSHNHCPRHCKILKTTPELYTWISPEYNSGVVFKIQEFLYNWQQNIIKSTEMTLNVNKQKLSSLSLTRTNYFHHCYSQWVSRYLLQQQINQFVKHFPRSQRLQLQNSKLER